MEKNVKNGIVRELFKSNQVNVVSGRTGVGKTNLIMAFLDSLGPDFYCEVITNTEVIYQNKEPNIIIHPCTNDFMVEKNLQNIVDDVWSKKRLFIDHQYNNGLCPPQIYIFDGIFNPNWAKYLKNLVNSGRILNQLNTYIILVEQTHRLQNMEKDLIFNCIKCKDINRIILRKEDNIYFINDIPCNIKHLKDKIEVIKIEDLQTDSQDDISYKQAIDYLTNYTGKMIQFKRGPFTWIGVIYGGRPSEGTFEIEWKYTIDGMGDKKPVTLLNTEHVSMNHFPEFVIE